MNDPWSASPEPEELDLPDAWEPPDGPRSLPLADQLATEEFADGAVADQAAAERCIRCGNSCRSVYLWQGDLALFKERDTKKWVEYHDIDTFTRRMPDGRTFWGIKLDRPCRHLIQEPDGRWGCAVYSTRPYVCRIYAGVNPDGPQPGCGFGAADA